MRATFRNYFFVGLVFLFYQFMRQFSTSLNYMRNIQAASKIASESYRRISRQVVFHLNYPPQRIHYLQMKWFIRVTLNSQEEIVIAWVGNGEDFKAALLVR